MKNKSLKIFRNSIVRLTMFVFAISSLFSFKSFEQIPSPLWVAKVSVNFPQQNNTPIQVFKSVTNSSNTSLSISTNSNLSSVNQKSLGILVPAPIANAFKKNKNVFYNATIKIKTFARPFGNEGAEDGDTILVKIEVQDYGEYSFPAFVVSKFNHANHKFSVYPNKTSTSPGVPNVITSAALPNFFGTFPLDEKVDFMELSTTKLSVNYDQDGNETEYDNFVVITDLTFDYTPKTNRVTKKPTISYANVSSLNGLVLTDSIKFDLTSSTSDVNGVLDYDVFNNTSTIVQETDLGLLEFKRKTIQSRPVLYTSKMNGDIIAFTYVESHNSLANIEDYITIYRTRRFNNFAPNLATTTAKTYYIENISTDILDQDRYFYFDQLSSTWKHLNQLDLYANQGKYIDLKYVDGGFNISALTRYKIPTATAASLSDITLDPNRNYIRTVQSIPPDVKIFKINQSGVKTLDKVGRGKPYSFSGNTEDIDYEFIKPVVTNEINGRNEILTLDNRIDTIVTSDLNASSAASFDFADFYFRRIDFETGVYTSAAYNGSTNWKVFIRKYDPSILDSVFVNIDTYFTSSPDIIKNIDFSLMALDNSKYNESKTMEDVLYIPKDIRLANGTRRFYDYRDFPKNDVPVENVDYIINFNTNHLKKISGGSQLIYRTKGQTSYTEIVDSLLLRLGDTLFLKTKGVNPASSSDLVNARFASDESEFFAPVDTASLKKNSTDFFTFEDLKSQNSVQLFKDYNVIKVIDASFQFSNDPNFTTIFPYNVLVPIVPGSKIYYRRSGDRASYKFHSSPLSYTLNSRKTFPANFEYKIYYKEEKIELVKPTNIEFEYIFKDTTNLYGLNNFIGKININPGDTIYVRTKSDATDYFPSSFYKILIPKRAPRDTLQAGNHVVINYEMGRFDINPNTSIKKLRIREINTYTKVLLMDTVWGNSVFGWLDSTTYVVNLAGSDVTKSFESEPDTLVVDFVKGYSPNYNTIQSKVDRLTRTISVDNSATSQLEIQIGRSKRFSSWKEVTKQEDREIIPNSTFYYRYAGNNDIRRFPGEIKKGSFGASEKTPEISDFTITYAADNANVEGITNEFSYKLNKYNTNNSNNSYTTGAYNPSNHNTVTVVGPLDTLYIQKLGLSAKNSFTSLPLIWNIEGRPTLGKIDINYNEGTSSNLVGTNYTLNHLNISKAKIGSSANGTGNILDLNKNYSLAEKSYLEYYKDFDPNKFFASERDTILIPQKTPIPNVIYDYDARSFTIQTIFGILNKSVVYSSKTGDIIDTLIDNTKKLDVLRDKDLYIRNEADILSKSFPSEIDTLEYYSAVLDTLKVDYANNSSIKSYTSADKLYYSKFNKNNFVLANGYIPILEGDTIYYYFAADPTIKRFRSDTVGLFMPKKLDINSLKTLLIINYTRGLVEILDSKYSDNFEFILSRTKISSPNSNNVQGTALKINDPGNGGVKNVPVFAYVGDVNSTYLYFRIKATNQTSNSFGSFTSDWGELELSTRKRTDNGLIFAIDANNKTIGNVSNYINYYKNGEENNFSQHFTGQDSQAQLESGSDYYFYYIGDSPTKKFRSEAIVLKGNTTADTVRMSINYLTEYTVEKYGDSISYFFVEDVNDNIVLTQSWINSQLTGFNTADNITTSKVNGDSIKLAVDNVNMKKVYMLYRNQPSGKAASPAKVLLIKSRREPPEKKYFTKNTASSDNKIVEDVFDSRIKFLADLKDLQDVEFSYDKRFRSNIYTHSKANTNDTLFIEAFPGENLYYRYKAVDKVNSQNNTLTQEFYSMIDSLKISDRGITTPPKVLDIQYEKELVVLDEPNINFSKFEYSFNKNYNPRYFFKRDTLYLKQILDTMKTDKDLYIRTSATLTKFASPNKLFKLFKRLDKPTINIDYQKDLFVNINKEYEFSDNIEFLESSIFSATNPTKDTVSISKEKVYDKKIYFRYKANETKSVSSSGGVATKTLGNFASKADSVTLPQKDTTTQLDKNNNVLIDYIGWNITLGSDLYQLSNSPNFTINLTSNNYVTLVENATYYLRKKYSSNILNPEFYSIPYSFSIPSKKSAPQYKIDKIKEILLPIYQTNQTRHRMDTIEVRYGMTGYATANVFTTDASSSDTISLNAIVNSNQGITSIDDIDFIYINIKGSNSDKRFSSDHSTIAIQDRSSFSFSFQNFVDYEKEKLVIPISNLGINNVISYQRKDGSWDTFNDSISGGAVVSRFVNLSPIVAKDTIISVKNLDTSRANLNFASTPLEVKIPARLTIPTNLGIDLNTGYFSPLPCERYELSTSANFSTKINQKECSVAGAVAPNFIMNMAPYSTQTVYLRIKSSNTSERFASKEKSFLVPSKSNPATISKLTIDYENEMLTGFQTLDAGVRLSDLQYKIWRQPKNAPSGELYSFLNFIRDTLFLSELLQNNYEDSIKLMLKVKSIVSNNGNKMASETVIRTFKPRERLDTANFKYEYQKEDLILYKDKTKLNKYKDLIYYVGINSNKLDTVNDTIDIDNFIGQYLTIYLKSSNALERFGSYPITYKLKGRNLFPISEQRNIEEVNYIDEEFKNNIPSYIEYQELENYNGDIDGIDLSKYKSTIAGKKVKIEVNRYSYAFRKKSSVTDFASTPFVINKFQREDARFLLARERPDGGVVDYDTETLTKYLESTQVYKIDTIGGTKPFVSHNPSNKLSLTPYIPEEPKGPDTTDWYVYIMKAATSTNFSSTIDSIYIKPRIVLSNKFMIDYENELVKFIDEIASANLEIKYEIQDGLGIEEDFRSKNNEIIVDEASNLRGVDIRFFIDYIPDEDFKSNDFILKVPEKIDKDSLKRELNVNLISTFIKDSTNYLSGFLKMNKRYEYNTDLSNVFNYKVDIKNNQEIDSIKVLPKLPVCMRKRPRNTEIKNLVVTFPGNFLSDSVCYSYPGSPITDSISPEKWLYKQVRVSTFINNSGKITHALKKAFNNNSPTTIPTDVNKIKARLLNIQFSRKSDFSEIIYSEKSSPDTVSYSIIPGEKIFYRKKGSNVNQEIFGKIRIFNIPSGPGRPPVSINYKSDIGTGAYTSNSISTYLHEYYVCEDGKTCDRTFRRPVLTQPLLVKPLDTVYVRVAASDEAFYSEPQILEVPERPSNNFKLQKSINLILSKIDVITPTEPNGESLPSYYKNTAFQYGYVLKNRDIQYSNIGDDIPINIGREEEYIRFRVAPTDTGFASDYIEDTIPPSTLAPIEIGADLYAETTKQAMPKGYEYIYVNITQRVANFNRGNKIGNDEIIPLFEGLQIIYRIKATKTTPPSFTDTVPAYKRRTNLGLSLKVNIKQNIVQKETVTYDSENTPISVYSDYPFTDAIEYHIGTPEYNANVFKDKNNYVSVDGESDPIILTGAADKKVEISPDDIIYYRKKPTMGLDKNGINIDSLASKVSALVSPKNAPFPVLTINYELQTSEEAFDENIDFAFNEGSLGFSPINLDSKQLINFENFVGESLYGKNLFMRNKGSDFTFASRTNSIRIPNRPTIKLKNRFNIISNKEIEFSVKLDDSTRDKVISPESITVLSDLYKYTNSPEQPSISRVNDTTFKLNINNTKSRDKMKIWIEPNKLPGNKNFKSNEIDLIYLPIANAVVPYPNPATTLIRFQSKITYVKIEIFDIFGILLKSVSGSYDAISIDELPVGSYYVLLYTSSGKVATTKFIKIR